MVYPHTHLSSKLQIDIILTVLNALPFKQANISVEIYSADASLITGLALNIPGGTLHNLPRCPCLAFIYMKFHNYFTSFNLPYIAEAY